MIGALEFIIEGLLGAYWLIFSVFARIANTYNDVAGETWLTTLCGNLESLCTNTLMPAFSGVGMAIAVTYFLISVIGLVTEDRFTPEFLAKFFAKLAISVAVIMWSPEILSAIIGFGDAMGNMFTGWAVNDFIGVGSDINATFSTFARAYMNSVEKSTGYKIEGNAWIDAYGWVSQNFTWDKNGNGNVLVDLGIIIGVIPSSALLLVISCLAVPLMSGVVYFVEISRNIELYIRGSLLPIAAGVMADDGWRGAGGRYFKKILALATQKIVLSLTCVMTSAMTIMYLTAELTSTDNNNVLDFLGASFGVIVTAGVICFAGLSFMFKSLQVVNDLWGAS